jgi:DNA-binding transcriptional regulator YiaG
MTRVSPRKPDQLPAATADELRAAKAHAEAAHAELKAAVRAALKVGSVRQVAATLGISPTTVQAWARPTD